MAKINRSRPSGYDCEFLFPSEVEPALKLKQFDLCILSAMMPDHEKAHVCAILAGSMPVIKLQTLMLAPDLLKMVREFSGDVKR